MYWRNIIFSLLDIFLPIGKVGDSLRGKVMTPMFKKCGKNLKIKKGAYFLNPKKIIIGNNVFIGNYNNFGAGEIILDDEVLLAPLISFNASTHTQKNSSYRFGESVEGIIHIKRGVWIGVNCAIMSNVTIGEGSLIAAGTIVRRSVKSNCTYIPNIKHIKINTAIVL